MITAIIYLDGQTSECGYKYLIKKDFSSWTACKNDNEFRYFLQTTGLKIDTSFTEICDQREYGRGRFISINFHTHDVEERDFWNTNEIPSNAIPFIGMCNGSYVNCYTVIEQDKTTIYMPNPNAKSIYIPYVHSEIVERLKKGVFLNGYENSVENTFKYMREK